MNRSSRMRPLGAILALAVGVSASSAMAQQPNSGARPQRGGQAGGQFARTGGMSAMMAPYSGMMFNSKLRDPLSSNLFGLLKRADVYSELRITSKQRETIEQAQGKTAEALPGRIQQAVMQNMPDFSGLRDLSPEERRQKMGDFRDQIQNNVQNAMQNFMGDIEKDLSGILTQSQLKRLKELDLQWRGPLALGDPKVAETFEFDADQKKALQEIVTEYRTKQTEVRSKMIQGMFSAPGAPNAPRPNAPNGATGGAGASGGAAGGASGGNVQVQVFSATGQNGGGAAARQRGGAGFQMPDPKALEEKMLESQKEVDKIIAALEGKVLKLLSDDQTAHWRELQGRKFTFRKNL